MRKNHRIQRALTETWLDLPITANVNIDNTCNAYYDGSVNFFRSGGGCNNSGEIADTVSSAEEVGPELNYLIEVLAGSGRESGS